MFIRSYDKTPPRIIIDLDATDGPVHGGQSGRFFELAGDLAKAKELYGQTGKAARVFKDFAWQTLDSWRCLRRVVGKAEHLDNGANPRFVVTSLSKDPFDVRLLYEDMYCGRGDMENRIKEQL